MISTPPLAPAPHAKDVGLEGRLASIARRIRENWEKRSRIAKGLARLKSVNFRGVEGMVESFLVSEVEKNPLANITVAGVDGGLLEQQLHGIDFILVRAVGVMFHYSNAELKWAEYLPSESPPPRLMDVAEPLDAREFEFLVGMERQLAELEIAVNVVEEESIRLLLLDGSIVPQYVDHFPHNPLLLGRYQKLIEKYVELYQTCVNFEVFLAGAVKDSRGARFMELLRCQVLPPLAGFEFKRDDLHTLEGLRDTVLLDHLLGVGERTMVFAYAEKPASHVLRDLGLWGEKVYVFYIKTVPFDQPLRVEFLDHSSQTVETAREVASLVYALSSNHDAFGFPSVLIEADACGRLTEDDLCLVRDGILDQLGPMAPRELRRNRRPF